MRVLIVDDYPDAAEITCALMKLLGHECHTATSGRAALAAADAFEPDLAILDIGLPDCTGYDLLRALRARFAGRPPFVVALTGWPEARDAALAAGFDHCLFKPADREDLVSVIELARQRLDS